MEAPNEDDSRVFTKSERILLDYQKLKRMSAADLKDLIQQVLKNPEFNIDEVDHDMHERLQRAIDIGDIDVTDFWQEGDGEQDVKFFCRKVEKVLRELLSDERLAGCQHFGFKEYKNSNGDRLKALFIHVHV
jgi:hypothetical protein